MRFLPVIKILFFCFACAGITYAQPRFYAEDSVGCTPFTTVFTLDPTSVDMDTITTVEWYFGFGDTITAVQPDPVLFEEAGRYSVILILNNHHNRPYRKTNYVIVYQSVYAAFEMEEYNFVENDTNHYYRFVPLDKITDAALSFTYTWTYMNYDSTGMWTSVYNDINSANQLVTIDTSILSNGTYIITLEVEDTRGCYTTYDQVLRVTDAIELPNVFVPENNRYYEIDPQDRNVILHFKLFNRYGLLVFEQKAPIISWDGNNNAGTELHTGVYYYVLEGLRGDVAGKYSKSGFIHLFR